MMVGETERAGALKVAAEWDVWKVVGAERTGRMVVGAERTGALAVGNKWDLMLVVGAERVGRLVDETE